MEPPPSKKLSVPFGPALDKLDRLNAIPDDALGIVARSVPEDKVGQFALASRDLARAARARPITEGCRNRIGSMDVFASHKSAARDELNLRHCLAINDEEEGLDRLRYMQIGQVLLWIKNVKVLDLTDNAIDDVDLYYLLQQMVGSKLTSLNMNGNDLQRHGADNLARNVDKLTSLTSLDLGNNILGGYFGELEFVSDVSGVRALADALKNNAVLTHLDLSHNYLCGINNDTFSGTYDPSGIQALASALSGTSVLTSLNLSNNSIGGYYDYDDDTNFVSDPSGIQALASALKGNGVLTNLDLSRNVLCGINENGRGTYDATGIRALANALQVNRKLTSLNLSSNQLCGLNWLGTGTYNSTGIQALASVLEGDAVLTTLDLSGNALGPTGAAAIAAALNSDRAKLTKLVVKHNSLGDDGRNALQDAVNGRARFELVT